MVTSTNKKSQNCLKFCLNDILVILLKIAKCENNCAIRMEIHKLVKQLKIDIQSMYVWQIQN